MEHVDSLGLVEETLPERPPFDALVGAAQCTSPSRRCCVANCTDPTVVEPHFALLSLGCHVAVAMAGAGHPDEAYEWGRGLPTAARGRHPTAHHRRNR
jgi:hypothetical protein